MLCFGRLEKQYILEAVDVSLVVDFLQGLEK